MRLSAMIGTFPMDGQTMQALVNFDEAMRMQRKAICEQAFALFPDLAQSSPDAAASLQTLMLNDYREYGDEPGKPYLIMPTCTIQT